MKSRKRDDVTHLFECFCEVLPHNKDDTQIVQKFPTNFSNFETLKSILKFAYPCEIENTTIQHYSFVLTDLHSKWSYGYCRHDPDCETAIVVLSYLPWHEIFYKLLNFLALLKQNVSQTQIVEFLGKLYNQTDFRSQNQVSTCVPKSSFVFTYKCPVSILLPSIPENRNLTEYYNAVDINSMIEIFASIMHERRIIFTSRKLSRLSSCVQTANDLLYPMMWQHIFIPVLPMSLIDYLTAPMPYLIGVPDQVLQWSKRHELGDVVILNADTNTIITPFDDTAALPPEVIHVLKRNLRKPDTLLGDAVPRAFLKALVVLIGGYRDALEFKAGERITFNEQSFIQTRPGSIQPFLKKILHLQLFQQFIDDRLSMLNSGRGFSDEFEFEVYNYTGKSGWKTKLEYGQWMKTAVRGGSSAIKNFTHKANPTNTVKMAVKTFKDTGKGVKSMYLNFKSKVDDSNHNQNMKFQDLYAQEGSPKSNGLYKSTYFDHADDFKQFENNTFTNKQTSFDGIIDFANDDNRNESERSESSTAVSSIHTLVDTSSSSVDDLIMFSGGLSNPLYTIYNDQAPKLSDQQLLKEYGLSDFKQSNGAKNTELGKQ